MTPKIYFTVTGVCFVLFCWPYKWSREDDVFKRNNLTPVTEMLLCPAVLTSGRLTSPDVRRLANANEGKRQNTNKNQSHFGFFLFFFFSQIGKFPNLKDFTRWLYEPVCLYESVYLFCLFTIVKNEIREAPPLLRKVAHLGATKTWHKKSCATKTWHKKSCATKTWYIFRCVLASL